MPLKSGLPSAKRGAGEDFRFVLGQGAVRHLGGEPAGGDGIHANAARGEFDGEFAGVGDEIVGDLVERHLGDVEAMLTDEVEQQVEGTLEVLEPHPESRGRLHNLLDNAEKYARNSPDRAVLIDKFPDRSPSHARD